MTGITSTATDLSAATAYATGPAAVAVDELCAGLEAGLGVRTAAAVFYFASAAYDPADLAGPISSRFPSARVIGCSTAGEFTDSVNATGGISAVALPIGVLRRVSAGIGELAADAGTGTDAAVAAVQSELGQRLSDLDPSTHLAFALIDGMHGDEERVNERLGDAAPLLNVVGGSAGDDLAFERTWVSVDERISWHGVALLVAEVGVPFEIVKSCSFVSSGTRMEITKADVPNRTVIEFDHRPAVQAYADALGVPAGSLPDQFMAHPVGLMLDGQPWIRSPQTVVDEGLKFYAQILEGMEVDVMTSTDVIGETDSAVRAAVEAVGGRASGAVMFNCILRRLEMDANDQGEAFVRALGGIPTAGFHTYGETWLGHCNQTITGVVFG